MGSLSLASLDSSLQEGACMAALQKAPSYRELSRFAYLRENTPSNSNLSGVTE